MTPPSAPPTLFLAARPWGCVGFFRTHLSERLEGDTGALLLDMGVHRMVFVHPAGSTAALGLVFAPFLILCVGMPVILGVAYTVQALRRNSSPRPSPET